jgi:hypothetical protein
MENRFGGFDLTTGCSPSFRACSSQDYAESDNLCCLPEGVKNSPSVEKSSIYSA